MRVIYIGTLAPSMAGWWHDLIDRGSHGSTYVQALRGSPDKWSSHHEIRRCNPLSWQYAESRRTLLEERDEARTDERKKAEFLSYRLNIPTLDYTKSLLGVDDWKRAMDRNIGERDGNPIVGVDLGGGRAWAAAVAIWASGRVEAHAVAPGIPDLSGQEKRDRVGGALYRKLHERGLLGVADGLRVQPPKALLEAILDRWGMVAGIICDRFRLAELEDAAAELGLRVPIVARVTRWSEASDDVRALRRMAADGPLSVPEEDALLISASLSVAEVKTDDQGNTRLSKNKNNTARDDVAAALLLVAGCWERENRRRPMQAAPEEEVWVAR